MKRSKRHAHKTSRSDETIKSRKQRTKRPKRVTNKVKRSKTQNKITYKEYHHTISRNPSTDSLIYVGTFYYSYPIIDLTKSDSNLPNAFDATMEKQNVLVDNNLQQGDSATINAHLSLITIRPPSVRSLLSSASENTIYYDTNNGEEVVKNVPSSVIKTSRSDLKLHHSYALNQDLELTINSGDVNDKKTNSHAEIVVQEIIDNLPDLVAATASDNLSQETVDGPQITAMDVDMEF